MDRPAAVGRARCPRVPARDPGDNDWALRTVMDAESAALEQYTELHLKPAILDQFGLPDIGYPLTDKALAGALSGGGELPFAEMLHGLQLKSQDGGADWRSMRGAMDRLAALLEPDDDRAALSAAGEDWWLEVAPVELGCRIVTIQRGDLLVAAVARRADGRLRVAAYQPLDGKAAGYLIGLGRTPHPVHGVCMRENNWEYALDCSAGAGNGYADERGEAYLSLWDHGLGVGRDGNRITVWADQADSAARPATRTVTELGVYHMLCESQ